MSAYSLENEAFAALVKYGSVALFKMVAMSPLTGIYRMVHKSFMTEEDAARRAGNDKEKMKKLLAKNSEVERVKAAHLNDLENIVPFFLISMLYVGTRPDPETATLLFRIFAGSRILHTIVYLGKVRQPARAIAFLGGLVVNMYMTIQLIKSSW